MVITIHLPRVSIFALLHFLLISAWYFFTLMVLFRFHIYKFMR